MSTTTTAAPRPRLTPKQHAKLFHLDVFRKALNFPDNGLDRNAHHVFSTLATFANPQGVAYPGLQRLADDCRFKSTASVKKAIDVGIAAGFGERIRAGTFGRTTVYRLTIPPALWDRICPERTDTAQALSGHADGPLEALDVSGHADGPLSEPTPTHKGPNSAPVEVVRGRPGGREVKDLKKQSSSSEPTPEPTPLTVDALEDEISRIRLKATQATGTIRNPHGYRRTIRDNLRTTERPDVLAVMVKHPDATLADAPRLAAEYEGGTPSTPVVVSHGANHVKTPEQHARSHYAALVLTGDPDDECAEMERAWPPGFFDETRAGALANLAARSRRLAVAS